MTALRPKPPGHQIDRGWAWVVLLSSILLQGISNGLLMTVGVFIPEWIVAFQKGPAVVCWVGSISCGIYLLLTPLTSAICNRFSHRTVIVTFSVFAAVWILISAFMPNLYSLYLTFGVLVGLGVSGIYSPSYMFVSHYFDRYSSMAVGLSSLGSAIGPMAMAPLFTFFNELYGWRGAMILASGITLNGCVLGALMCPSESWISKGYLSTKHESKIVIDSSNGKVNTTVNSNNTVASGKKLNIFQLFDIDLLRDYRQWLLMLNSVAWNMSTYVWWMFLVDHAGSIGLSPTESAAAVSITTGSSAVIRIVVSGAMLMCPSLDPYHILTISGFGAGISSFLIPHLTDKIPFILLCAKCGLYIGLYNAALGVVVVNIYGVEKCTGSFSYVMAGAGIGALTGPPIAGNLYDGKSYNMSFYLSGVTFLVSSFILLIGNVMKCYKRKCGNPNNNKQKINK